MDVNKTKQSQTKRRGSALVLVMFAVLILTIGGVGLLSLGTRGRILAIRDTQQIQARSAADAGLTKAVFEMNAKLIAKDFDNSFLPRETDQALDKCDSVFSYKIVAKSLNNSNEFRIESVGESGQTIRTVDADVGLKGLYEFAIFGCDYVELKNNSVVDWSNFDADDKPLTVGTNAIGKDTLVLHNDCLIKGDATVGPHGNPANAIKLDEGAVIEGNAYSKTELWETPEVAVPQWLEDMPSSGDLTKPNTITMSGKYRSISLKNSEIITIDGPVVLYVTDYLGLDTNGQLQISHTNPKASLTLYLGGNMITNNGGFVNNQTKDPKRLTIYCVEGCDKVEFKTDCDLFGTIYGPETDLIMRNSVNIYGAVVGKTFIQYKAAVFTYDPSLRNVSVYDEGVRFVVKRWSEY